MTADCKMPCVNVMIKQMRKDPTLVSESLEA